MAKTKRKNSSKTELKNQKSIQELLPVQEAKSDSPDERTKRIEFWKAEIASLKQAKYSTVEEAVESIVDKAISRFNQSPDEQMRGVLTKLLLSDPEIVETVKGALRVR